ncbi:ribosome small subunit-dependent GTPase A [Nocardioidaceae bacterium]|nr:ribosome small subunit-dependent GTPase A [Nocardioidaceae bacterium]
MSRRYTDRDPEYYERPRRRTRPRTKERPSYDDAVLGRVVTVDRGRLTLVLDDPGADDADGELWAVKSRNLGRKGVVVGDRVKVVGDLSGDDGSLARVVELVPRTNVLRRTADDSDPVERIVVANAEQMVVVAALADPEPRARLIDRALVAAFAAGMDPLLCLTKADLADPADLLAAYEPLGVPAVAVERGGDLDALRERLAGRTSVLVGHSGVGKSTLVNALVPGTDRAVGVVNDVTGRGRHTSTSAYLLELPVTDPAAAPAETDGGWIVDTPGIRSFGLAHVGPQELLGAFDDLEAVTTACPRGCEHAEASPECALDDAAERGEISQARLGSFRRLLASRERAEGD